jgi:D-alanyl-lipoteichoic acid acyltransferase DltB (MBOAT superfamily)
VQKIFKGAGWMRTEAGPMQTDLTQLGDAAPVVIVPRADRGLASIQIKDQAETPAEHERPDHLKFVLLLVQLAGLACAIQRFQLESRAFFELSLLAFGGFAIHYLLPLRYRMGFFTILSLVSIGWVMGVPQAAWLIGLGLVLLGICHLPVNMRVRVGLLLIVGGVLAALRAGWVSGPWSAAIWPILASMFMFRLVVYLYDNHYEPVSAPLMQRLAYFFMLPNVCFPLFPVVDYKTFLRTYYNSERHQIHQVGVDWILRGVIQLLLYRVINQAWVIDPYDVANIGDIVRYFLWLYALYLRVSGQFHVIVGMLHLFGFNLPETHHLYYFASSFTDYWRRINIYWKDFMMKVFYYPMFFRLKKLGPTRSLVLSTMCVFFATWALHAYQWFWIRGSYQFSWNDVLFWTILCGLVIVNSLWEARRGRKRTLGGPKRTTWSQVALALQTAATFVTICVLWSLWNSESLEMWMSLWHSAAVPPNNEQWRVFVGVFMAGLGGLAIWVVLRRWISQWQQPSYFVRAAAGVVTLFLLNALSVSRVYNQLGSAGTLIATARFGGLNRTEMNRLERGYYEDLMTVDRFNGELSALYMKRPREWTESLVAAGLAQPARGLQYDLRPNAKGHFKGALLQTNQWGLHDQEYSQTPPPGAIRIAVLGASHTMGSGVERDKTFEAILEQRLNRDRERTDSVHYEILNFAVYGYNPIEQIRVLNDKVFRFEPDVVFYVGHPEDSKRVVQFVGQLARNPADLGHEYLSEIVKQSGIDAHTPPRLVNRRLEPYGDEILSWVHRTLVSDCRQRMIHPVWVLLPMVPESASATNSSRDLRIAQDAGFTVLDLTDVYDGHNRQELWIAEWDAHPNDLGHKLVGDRLYDLVHQRKESILIGRGR